MPDDENKNIEQPGENQVNDLDDTEAPKPSTYKMPDGRELTADEIAEALESKKNEKEWRRKNDEKGRLLNEERRRMNDDFRTMKDDISSFKNEYINKPPPEPRTRWEDEEDPEKRDRLFKEEISGRIGSVEKENREFRQGLTNKQREDAMTQENQHFQILADDVLDKTEGVPDDPELRKVVNATMGLELGEIGRQNWTPEEFKRAARKAVDSYNKIKTTGQNELVDKKKKDNKLKTGSPGSAPAPGKKKYTPGMSKKERDSIIFANMPE